MSGTKKKTDITAQYRAAIRTYLRIRATSLDSEINDLIRAARDDLILGGVKPEKARDESDHLIKRAVGLYVKSEFGIGNAESEKHKAAYNDLKQRLLLSSKYKVAQDAPQGVVADDVE